MLNHSEIQRLLAHRYPLLMIDSVCTLEPGKFIVARKCVTANEPCYACLTENAENEAWAYPSSLVVESFGQAAALLWLQTASSAGNKMEGIPAFVLARDCFFEKDVFPGDVMEHRVRFDRAVANNILFNGEVWVNEQRVARMEWVMAALVKPHIS